MSNIEEITNQAEIAEALRRIGKDDPDGLVRPEAVVEAARDEASPLHPYFEWDDTEAAHQYRLVQARKLIVRVGVTRVEQPPKYVNVVITRPDGSARRGYVPTERAVVDPDLFAQVCADARRGIAAYRARLSAFTEARKAVGALDAALNELRSLEGKRDAA